MAANINDCTLAYVRALTTPPIHLPSVSELKKELLAAWNVRIPVDTYDDITRIHWQEQKHTALFDKMFDWSDVAKDSKQTAALQPYFNFGSSMSPFFAPWEDVAHCLRHLLLHQIGYRQTSSFAALISHDTEVFLATAHNFKEEEIRNMRINRKHYLLRCHFDKRQNVLVFGYHVEKTNDFQALHEISLNDENWRLETCIILKNLARILNCLKDYAIPLTCNTKLSLVDDECCIQKLYMEEQICPNFHASVENMIAIYNEIADVPHTDHLVSVEERPSLDEGRSSVVCKFAPVGRTYLPLDISELLDALTCVAEALASLHTMGIMHRDIRWANVFHAFQEYPSNRHIFPVKGRQHIEFSHEWVLFDFEFAAKSPQPPFGDHTLTPGNHAPEMFIHGEEEARPHTTAVDIWGLGYLIQHSRVDLPASHAEALAELKDVCMDSDPEKRPNASHCLNILKNLQSKTPSREKIVKKISC